MKKEFLLVIFLLLGVVSTLQAVPPGQKYTMQFSRIPIEEGLSQNTVHSIFKDRKGFMWFGTQGGLNRYDGYEFKIYTHQPSFSNSLSDNTVYAITDDVEGRLWIGTGNGLNRFDPGTETFKRYGVRRRNANGISHSDIRALFRDSRGTLWIGTMGGGLNRFNSQDNTFTHYQNNPTDTLSLSCDSVSAILEDRRGFLWIATLGGGLNRLDPATNQFTRFMQKPGNATGLPENQIQCLALDEADNLLMGTRESGLTRFNTTKGTYHTFQTEPQNPKSISNNTIFSILPGGDGHVWIGTDGGLNLFEPLSQQFHRYRVNANQRDSLNDNTILALYGVLCGDIWLGTATGGINRIHCNRNALNLYRNEGGNPIIPPIVITDLKIFNKSVPIGKDKNGRTLLKTSIMDTEAIVLSYKDSVITFEYTALNYQFASKNRYAYILEGFEKEWNEVGTRRFANYTNLPAGTYYFKVKGSNNDGIWNQTGATIKITISQPYWHTWWFFLLAIGATLALIFFLYRWQMHKERNLNRRLEEEVARRIKEAEQAQKTAEEANKSKSQFLARMSHEIRTPLNGVLGFIPMLLDTSLTPAQLDYVKSINSGGKALLTLVNDILDFSKIEAGLMSLENVDFNPAVIAAEVNNLVRPRVEGKDVKISCYLSPQVPTTISSDPSRFRQVLLNLMGNAAKFTTTGEIELAITVVKENATQLKLHATIQDTGIGIPADKLESIFDVFQQADGSTTRHFGGSGLGLTICRQVALLMKGKVWAESELGKGSTFHFTAWVNKSQINLETDNEPANDVELNDSINHPILNTPTEAALEPPAQPQTPPSPAPTTTALNQPPPASVEENKVRVLLVEDNPLNQKLARYILTHAGYHTELAVNGQEAVDIVTARPDYFHLVLMDVQMPVMDGLEATRVLRQKGFTTIPIVAMTAQALKGDREKCLESGMNDFITKPIKRDEIFHILQKWSPPKEPL